MSTKRKSWRNPKLLILSRGKPEEAIMTHCKQNAGGLNQITATQVQGCSEGGYNCAACKARASC